jgi:hypothetical protein
LEFFEAVFGALDIREKTYISSGFCDPLETRIAPVW